MGGSITGLAYPIGCYAWRGERESCNTVPVEIILNYQIKSKVYTSLTPTAARLFQGLDNAWIPMHRTWT